MAAAGQSSAQVANSPQMGSTELSAAVLGLAPLTGQNKSTQCVHQNYTADNGAVRNCTEGKTAPLVLVMWASALWVPWISYTGI